MIAQVHQIPPIEQAAQLYADHGLVLARDLEAYLRHPFAYVVKNPEMLLLFRPVVLADVARWLDDPGEADAWYVHLLIGRAKATPREMPWPLPFCCWHRNFRTPGGRLHVAATDTIIKKLRNHYGRRTS